MSQNLSGLKPLGVAVLVRPHEPERRAGKIIIPENVSDRTIMTEDRVEVIAIGPNAWHDEPTPRAAVGDFVLAAKYSGYMVQGKDKKKYRVVNDRDIFAGIDADFEIGGANG